MLKRATDFANLLSRRRSCRQFSERPVDPEVVRLLVTAAGSSPSGAHTEPWTYVCVTNELMKRRIREIVEEEEEINYARRMSAEWKADLAKLRTSWEKPYLTEAPVIVVLMRQVHGWRSGREEKRQHYYSEISVSISAGLFLAAVQNVGLCTLTSTPMNAGPALRRLLGRPPNEKVHLLLPLGYAAHNAQVPNLTRKPVEKIMRRPQRRPAFTFLAASHVYFSPLGRPLASHASETVSGRPPADFSSSLHIILKSPPVRSGGIGDPHPAGVPDEGAEVSDIVRGGQLVHPLGWPRYLCRALLKLGMAERLCLYSVQLFQWSCAAVEQRAVGEAVNALAAPVHTDIQRNVVSARDGGLEAPPDVEGGGRLSTLPRSIAIRAHGLTSAPIAGWTTPEQQVEDDLPRSDVGGKIVLLEGVFPLRGETHGGGGRARSTTKGGRAVVQVSQEMDTRLASASSSWASSLKARMTLPLAFRIASTLMSRASFSQRKSSIMPIDASIWAVVSVPLAARTQILNFGSVATLAYVPALASFGLLGSSEGSVRSSGCCLFRSEPAEVLSSRLRRLTTWK
uniref:Nitroreductase domain-containing protein n=1 Tax=Macrostomum lignano TaxID=282301 RepID=A0A1I8JDF5_9PLAT